MALKSEKWRKIDELYNAARDREPRLRGAFLAEACGNDEDLRRRLEAMLAKDSGGGFIDQPAASLVPDPPTAPLSSGARLGPYKIEAEIGAGGMGRVYRALDTRLDRKVAIKVASSQFTSRFEREAKAISALNHPHICTLHDVGPNYLVMELVEGETLADRLKKGALPVGAALQYGCQIAEALEEAHSKAFTHRDLKPGNIMLAKSGVKVLDFGLAKRQRAEEDETITASQGVMGTAGYMAPEQLEGKECDARTDIFALGLILYEMAAGKRVFSGDSQAALIAATMRCDVPPMEGVSEKLAHVIKRCLEKDPENRWQSVRDLKLELEWAATPERVPAVIPSGARPRRRTRWAILVGVFAGVFAAGLSVAAVTLTIASRRTEIQVPNPSYILTPFSFEAGGQSNPVWSPDGKAVAFGARQRPTDPNQLYVRYLDSPVAIQITRMMRPVLPRTWTSAGKIVFYSPQEPAGLWSVSPTGGEPEPLLALPVPSFTSAAVSPDGSAVALVHKNSDGTWGLAISSPPGAVPEPYPAPFGNLNLSPQPHLRFSPDGKQILLVHFARGWEAWLMPFPANASHPPHRILENAPPPMLANEFSWMPDNRHIVVMRGGSEYGTALDLLDTVSGKSVTISRLTTVQGDPAVSPDGSKLVFRESRADHDIISVDLTRLDPDHPDATIAAGLPEVVTERSESMAAWAARAPVLAFTTDRNGEQGVWLHRPDQPDRPLVQRHDIPPTRGLSRPIPSPDGTRIIFSRHQSGSEATTLWISAVAGGAPARLLKDEAAQGEPGSWSPDGAWFVYLTRTGQGPASLNIVKTTGLAEAQVLRPNVQARKGPGGNSLPVWSPRGDWILYNDNGFKLTSSDGRTVREVASPALVYAFSPDGKSLYGIRQANGHVQVFSVPVTGGPERVVGWLGLEFLPVTRDQPGVRFTFAPGGNSITYAIQKDSANLWMLDGLRVPKPSLLERLGLR